MGNAGQPNWVDIRSEYIAGTISQKKLAEKYGIPYPTLRDRAVSQGWTKAREDARKKSVEIAVRKTAKKAADNAVTAQRIREKLLKRLEKEIDALPETIGTGKRNAVIQYDYNGKKIQKQKDSAVEYKLKDLTAAWKDLTDGLDIDDETGETDDGFIEALKGTAAEDWMNADEGNI